MHNKRKESFIYETALMFDKFPELKGHFTQFYRKIAGNQTF